MLHKPTSFDPAMGSLSGINQEIDEVKSLLLCLMGYIYCLCVANQNPVCAQVYSRRYFKTRREPFIMHTVRVHMTLIFKLLCYLRLCTFKLRY
jgi:hypothetical protein